ncbi:MAG TPA: MAPEG family protein [Minicystis sp.]|nr:MAPEG family protein [Minicystis sp.]
MPLLDQIDALRWFSFASAAIVLNLFFVANYTAIVRVRHKQVVNPEDAPTLDAKHADAEHAEVLRVHRAHRNAMENAVPFFVIGLLYALSAPSDVGAKVYFGVFAGARWLHTLFYLRKMQPFRTIAFIVGLLATLGMLVHVVRVAI